MPHSDALKRWQLLVAQALPVIAEEAVMKSTTLVFVALVCLTVIVPSLALAQEPEDEGKTRSTFLITRPKPSKTSTASSAKCNRPLGLGYSIYRKGPDGQPLRVNESHSFRAGDAVRLVIESNCHGYLYVFNAENGKDPRMIFPDPRLYGGDNRIRGHVPYEVPSSRETEPGSQWFVFDDKAATERLYLIVTRNPLQGVLTGEKLFAYCQVNPKECPWRPAVADWSRIADKVDVGVSVSRDRSFGQSQTDVERNSVDRGLGLPSGAPAPSVVKMNKSPKAEKFKTKVDLTHQ